VRAPLGVRSVLKNLFLILWKGSLKLNNGTVRVFKLWLFIVQITRLRVQNTSSSYGGNSWKNIGRLFGKEAA
jgi:hypothetical protein